MQLTAALKLIIFDSIQEFQIRECQTSEYRIRESRNVGRSCRIQYPLYKL